MKLENKEMDIIKKQENTYIYNIDACYLYRAMTEDIANKDGLIINKKGCYSTKDISYDRLFTATIPYSLEMIRLDEYYPKEIYVKNKKQYTKAIVNVTFDENYNQWRDKVDSETGEIKLNEEGKSIRERYLVKSRKGMRKYLYTNGFTIDGQKYIFYKRGASKARTGSCLFIKEGMYKKMMNRSRLLHNKTKEEIKNKKGLFIDEGEQCDITSLNAYQSLVLSGIEDIIHIEPKSILLIDDIDSLPFEVESSVTREVNGKLQTKNEKVTRVNNMTDGQGLLDESVFKIANRSKKGMMLLRSDMFKCCAFNTKLQKFFAYMDSQGKIKDGKIKDKYRGWVDYKDILLVTTPSSIKFLKFKYKFKDDKECYEEWFNNIDNVFGIVKSDKEGNYGTWNRTTYQIINSMPLTKEQIKELMWHELEYVRLLKTDLAYFKNHIAIKETVVEQLEKDIEELDWDNEEDFKSDNGNYSTGEMINNILAINSDFQYTKIFKQFRRDQIKCYINELRKGKIRLEDTIYSTIVANPYEMLLHSIGEYDNTCLAKGTEIYCKFYEDNQKLATFRNPHINSGNVMVATNKWHDEYKWFNFSNNITIVNVSDNDFPDRGQGFDYDSDTLLHIPHKTFVDVAEKCQMYKTPLNLVKGDSKIRHNTLDELAELDDVLSNNFIGKIINKSQIINSYMWNCKSKGMDEELIQKLYDISSMLSSLSQIELDKAKKSFDNISMTKELKNINDMKYKGKTIIDFDIEYLFEEKVDSETGEIIKVPQLNVKGEQKKIKKMIVPKFFEYVAQDNTYRNTIKFNTPMDYLEEILDECRIRSVRGNKTIGDLLVQAKTLDGVRNMSEQHTNIYNIVKKCSRKINFLSLPSCQYCQSKKEIIRANAKKEALDSLRKMKVNPKTLYSIMQKCFGEGRREDDFSKIGMIMLSLLYKSQTLNILSLFKNVNNKNEYILIKDKNGDIDIFGYKYIKLKRAEIIQKP